MNENTNNKNENTTGAEDKTANETPTNAATSEQVGNETEEVAATTAIIKIEGQEFPLDVAIAADDQLLKTALSPHYPSIKNAQITRETRLGEMIVSIVKRAEHKGSGGR